MPPAARIALTALFTIASTSASSPASRHTPIRAPRKDLRSTRYRRGWSFGIAFVAGSARSRPWTTASVIAESITCRAMGPAVSCCAEIGTTPSRLTSPTVGLCPTTPVLPAGQTIDPSVSVPIATWASAAATPAPEPLEDPHALRSSTYGLLVRPPTALQPEVDMVLRKFAHSDRLALPITTAPARRSLRTSVASSGRACSSAREPAVVGRSSVSMLSFSSTGMPSSRLRAPCRYRCRSLAAASRRARRFTRSTALTSSSSRAIRRR